MAGIHSSIICAGLMMRDGVCSFNNLVRVSVLSELGFLKDYDFIPQMTLSSYCAKDKFDKKI